jgi:hypothetical protein
MALQINPLMLELDSDTRGSPEAQIQVKAYAEVRSPFG